MVVNMKEILKDAKNNHYAVPQFNIHNLEWTKFILEECAINNSPVILGVSESAVEYMGGYNVVSGLIYDLVHDLKIQIPVVIHLDHGSSFESCKKAIDANFTSVMIDGSKLSLEENIELTKKVVEYSKTKKVTVEAEIGEVGRDGQVHKTSDVNECIKLVQETGVDCLAPSVGNIHGIYKDEPKLDMKRLKEISDKTNIPLVLHGASGIPDNQIQKAIKSGVCKVNINTELQVEWTNSIKKLFEKDNEIYDIRKINKYCEFPMKRIIKNKIVLLDSLYKG